MVHDGHPQLLRRAVERVERRVIGVEVVVGGVELHTAKAHPGQPVQLGGEVAPAVGVERAERDEAATLRAERGDRLVADDAGDGGSHLGEQDGVVDALALEHGGEVRGIGAGLADGIIDLGRGAERPEPLQRAVRALGILRQVNVKVNQKLTVEHRKTPLSSCLL